MSFDPAENILSPAGSIMVSLTCSCCVISIHVLEKDVNRAAQLSLANETAEPTHSSIIFTIID